MFNSNFSTMFEVILGELVGLVLEGNLLVLVVSQFDDDFFHVFDPVVMFEVVAEHLEDDFAERKKIFIGFEVLILLRKPII